MPDIEKGQDGGCMVDASRRKRFFEAPHFAPIAFAVFTILTLWAAYTFFHCARLLQLGSWHRPGPIDEHARRLGWIELAVFHYFTCMLVVCYVRCILVHPGTLPSNDSAVSLGLPAAIEMKKTGLRRYCKWCKKYKPDRCHHCRQCRTCILKMDHHCPWIFNCVGYANYKFFVLLLVYSVLACIQILVTMASTVRQCIDDPATPFLTLLFTLFGESLAAFLTLLLGAFLGFHIWLICNAMTTIEFVEKYQSKPRGSKHGSWDPHIYSLGFCGNIKAVLGDNMWLWFFPCSRPAGNGMSFLPEQVCPPKNLEGGKESRPRAGGLGCGSGFLKLLCGSKFSPSFAGKRKENRQATD